LKFFSALPGKPRNDDSLADSIEKFELAYRKKGFLLAHVSSVSDGKAGELQIHVDEWMLGQLVPEPSIQKPSDAIVPALWVGTGNGPQFMGIWWMERYPWDRRKFLFNAETRQYSPATESERKLH